MVRDKRKNTQTGATVPQVIRSWGSDFLDRFDKKARTMIPHSTSMETHRARHRRTSDYHHLRPRQPDRSGVLAATVDGDLLAHAAPGRAPPRPDRGPRPSGRPRTPAAALPGPHREGRSRAGPPAEAWPRWCRDPAEGDATLPLQDDLRRGHRRTVAHPPQARGDDRG